MRARLDDRARIRADHGKPWINGTAWDNRKSDNRKCWNHGHEVDEHHESVVSDDTGCQLCADLLGWLVGVTPVEWQVSGWQFT